MLLELGNSSALEPQVGTFIGDETSETVRIPGDQITTIEVPDVTPLDAALTEIKTVWRLHSEAESPDWVEGNNDLLVQAVASTFGCVIGRDAAQQDEEPVANES